MVKGVNADIPVIGVVKYPDRMVMILDFESIVAFVMPGEADINFEEIEKLANARIAIADDSNFILEMVKNFLSQGGYEDIISFPDGQQTLDYLLGNLKSIDVLITDHIRHKGESVCADFQFNKIHFESILRHLGTMKL